MEDYKVTEIQTQASKLSTGFIIELIKLCDENAVDRNELIKSTISLLSEYIKTADFNSM